MSSLVLLLPLLLCCCGDILGAVYKYPFLDPALDWDTRVNDLVGRLTIDEIITQSMEVYSGPTPGVPRLGIQPHIWISECLHGHVNTNGTNFPQSIGLSAAFSYDVIHRMAEATSYEIRAHNNGNLKQGTYQNYYGLSCYSPVINIARHPLWGRNQETYGEDPYMNGYLSQAYVHGLQGNHSRYERATSGCKHLDVYAGPENIPVSRLSFDAKVSTRDWRMTFLPAFKMCVEAGTYNLVCSYNKINGVPACVNKKLLVDIVRNEWGFRGYISTDDGATAYMISKEHYFKTGVEVVKASVEATVNLELGGSFATEQYTHAKSAIQKGMITAAQLRERVKPLFYARMRQGEFDPEEMVPYRQIPMSVVQSPEHQELAVTTAMKTFVLLKNDGNLLPLKSKVNKLAVVGPMADNVDQLYGDYAPTFEPQFVKTPLQGLTRIAANVTSAPGCTDLTPCTKYDSASLTKAVTGADLVVVCLGTGQAVEAEGHDRSTLALPGKQLQLLQDAVKAANGKPVIVLLFNAGPLDVSWAKSSPAVHVIMGCFISGQGTGEALARTFMNEGGNASPAGRLPMTWPMSLDQYPDITNYTMVESTYRYFTQEPLYPFAYGLSYSTFTYSNLNLSATTIQPGQLIEVTVTVKNNGPYNAEEVVQVYISWDPSNKIAPFKQLVGFRRVLLMKGQSQTLTFEVSGEQMQVWVDDNTGFNVLPGKMTVYAGGQQPGQKTMAPSNVLQTSFSISTI